MRSGADQLNVMRAASVTSWLLLTACQLAEIEMTPQRHPAGEWPMGDDGGRVSVFNEVNYQWCL